MEYRNGIGVARQDLVDLTLLRTPKGECQERERVLTSGLPHLAKKFIPSHLIQVIPNAGGEASVAAAHAADRVRPGGGVRDQKGSTAVVRVRVQYLVGVS